MLGLTGIQLKVLEFLVEYQDLNGCGPSQRTIAQHFEWASSYAPVSHLEALERKGYITRKPRMPGHIRILKRPEVAQVVEAA